MERTLSAQLKVPSRGTVTRKYASGDRCLMALISFSDASVEVLPGRTIQAAVSAAGRLPDAYIFLIDGRPVPMDTVLLEDVEVRAV